MQYEIEHCPSQRGKLFAETKSKAVVCHQEPGSKKAAGIRDRSRSSRASLGAAQQICCQLHLLCMSAIVVSSGWGKLLGMFFFFLFFFFFAAVLWHFFEPVYSRERERESTTVIFHVYLCRS